MNLYFNRDIERLVTSAASEIPIKQFRFKSGDVVPLDLRFYSNGSVTTITGESIWLILKEARTGDVLAGSGNWALSDGVYSSEISMNTDPLDAALTGKYLDLLAELSFSDDGDHVSSQTIPVTFERQVYQGTETIPPADDALIYETSYLTYTP